jgi:hypothetical protein
LVGAGGNQVYFSENFNPYNWPAEYDLTLPYNIVNLGTVDSTVYVTTSGRAYVIEGAPSCRPLEGRQVLDTDVPLPDIGRRAHSAVATPFGLVFATLDGLVLVDPKATFQVLTAPWFGRDEWIRGRPETIRLAYWRGYLVFVTDGLGGCLLEIDAKTYGDGEAGTLTTFKLEEGPVDDLAVTSSGELLLMIGGGIYQWAGGQRLLPYTWVSTPQFLAGDTTLTTARLYMDGRPGTVDLALTNEQGVSFYTRASGGRAFRVKRLPRSAKYTVSLMGEAEVSGVELGTSMVTLGKGV